MFHLPHHGDRNTPGGLFHSQVALTSRKVEYGNLKQAPAFPNSWRAKCSEGARRRAGSGRGVAKRSQ